MRRRIMHKAWHAESTKADVIAGLSAPSFVIVAAALTLTIAALAARTAAPTVAAPAVKQAAAAPESVRPTEQPMAKP
jgi:hypothetical protein